MNLRILALALGLASAPGLAQTPLTAKTTEQQARSYVLNAFMTGVSPMILSDDVAVAPELRQRLNVAPEDGSRAIYRELLRITGGKPLSVRPAIRDEIRKVQARPEPGKALFTVETGDDTLLVQYDLERDVVSFVGQPSAVPVAARAPVKEPPQAENTPPVTTPPVADPKPVESRPLQVIEPQVPRMVQPVSQPAAPPPAAQPPRPAMKRTGPCVIKPVMSDQDLVNCGATPH